MSADSEAGNSNVSQSVRFGAVRSWVARWRITALAALILLTTPFLAVATLDVMARSHFDRLEGDRDKGKLIRWVRYDTFKHAYASGVMTILFGDKIAEASGILVEWVEQNSGVGREHDLINNALGRQWAQVIAHEGNAHWRRDLADLLHGRMDHPDSAFSILYVKRQPTSENCRSD